MEGGAGICMMETKEHSRTVWRNGGCGSLGSVGKPQLWQYATTLCEIAFKNKDNYKVEFSLKDVNNPIGVGFI
jgi:hypothetical protein